MGQPAAIDQAFALHQLCHAHNLQEFGMVVDPAGLHPSVRKTAGGEVNQMDLNLSDEQRLLRESVDRFIAETYNADHRRKAAGDPLGFSPAIWKQFAELGWLALPIAEEFGGLGAGAIETGIVMEAFGRGLVSEPYLSTVVIGAGLIASRGSEAQKQEFYPRWPTVRCTWLSPIPSARRATISRMSNDGEEDGGRLAARRKQDRGARRPCRRPDHRLGANRQRQRRVRQSVPVPGATVHAGLKLRDYPRLGGGRACNLDLAAVRLPGNALLGDGSDCLQNIEAVIDRALAALGSEAVGIMQICSTDARIHKNAPTIRTAAVGQPGDPPPARRHGDAM